MIELECDIWDKYNEGEIVCVCTSGYVNTSGKAIMATGTEGQAARRYPEVALRLGQSLRKDGMRVCFLRERLLAFPTKWTTRHAPELGIVTRSFRELALMRQANGWGDVYLPFPGGKSIDSEVRFFLREAGNWIVLCTNNAYAAHDRERARIAHARWHEILSGKYRT